MAGKVKCVYVCGYIMVYVCVQHGVQGAGATRLVATMIKCKERYETIVSQCTRIAGYCTGDGKPHQSTGIEMWISDFSPKN